MCVLLLSGCGSQETFERVIDTDATPVMMQQSCRVSMKLPEEAAVPAMENESAGCIYLCDGYTVCVQTAAAGDLNRTFQENTGFTKDALTVIETQQQGITRYDCVWTAAGEGEEQICRGVILDDGSFHYVVTVMTNASDAERFAQQANAILDSVSLVSAD